MSSENKVSASGISQSETRSRTLQTQSFQSMTVQTQEYEVQNSGDASEEVFFVVDHYDDQEDENVDNSSPFFPWSSRECCGNGNLSWIKLSSPYRKTYLRS